MQDFGRLSFSYVLAHFNLCGSIRQAITLYTLKTVCFSRVTDHGNDQVGEGDNVCKHGLRWSLGLVVFIWTAVGLVVAINIAVDGAYNFYGPSGFCKPRFLLFVMGLILTWCRVLDSIRVLGPEDRCRLRLHVDNRSFQHRDLHDTFPLLQGLYHDRWLAHAPVVVTRADQHRWAPQTSLWLTFVRHFSLPRHPFF